MDAIARIARQVREEQDDVLAGIGAVQGDTPLEDRLYDRLVGLLVEGLFIDLRRRYVSGTLDREAFTEEISELAGACRAAGLLPLAR